MRMKRISLSLPHPLSRSLSFGRTITPIGGFSSKSPKFDPESVPKELATRHTEDRTNHSRQKKPIFLPSRDPQNLDLDAMCLDLESSRLPNQETPGRGNVASIHQHPLTHFPRDKGKKKSTARPGFPAASISSFHSTHPPTTSHFTPATALHPLPPSAEHHPEDPHPPSPPPPPNLATSQKTKISGQNRKGW